MIIVLIIFSAIYVVLLTMILIAYYRDVSDIEKRILYLEKRVSENENLTDKCIYHLNKLIERSNYLEWVHVPDTSQLMKFLNDCGKKKENNTQEGCDCEMACKKGRGGRKK